MKTAINTGCSRQYCTKFTHHDFATERHSHTIFSRKSSERKCSHGNWIFFATVTWTIWNKINSKIFKGNSWHKPSSS